MASTYLTRTPSSTGNRRKFTFSFWIKKCANGTNETIYNVRPGASGANRISFHSSDTFRIAFEPINKYIFTNRLFRDNSAWYHIVVAVDTEQGTAADRVKLYVNGVQETSFGTATYPDQNTDLDINTQNVINIGRDLETSSDYFNGIISHIHFIDGTAYDATAFGEFDANGVWKIKTSPSVTYGTDGFFILKDGNSVTDQSPNTNNLTVGGGTLTNTEDNPSNVFATLNPLGSWNDGGKGTFANGNTYWTSTTTDQDACLSTLAVNDGGKYYCEMKMISKTGGYWNPGVYTVTKSTYGTSPNCFVRTDGVIYNNGSLVASGLASWSANDICGMAYDGSGGTHTIQFYKNGVAYDSAKNISNSSNLPLFFGDGTNGGSVSNQVAFNFGNGYFGTTAVSSAGTNASGKGIFEYDVPTGYTALSTKGLNL